MVYVLHYIQDKKYQAKNVKQFLKKSFSFRAFGVPLDDVVRQLTNLGVLNTEQRVKRQRVVNEIHRGANVVNIIERRERYFIIVYDSTNAEHKKFLTFYQVIYPGEVYGA